LAATFRKAGGGLVLHAPKERWDWSRFVAIAVDLRNLSEQGVTLTGDLDRKSGGKGFIHLPAKGEGSLVLYLMRQDATEGTPFEGMNGTPGGRMKHWDVPGPVRTLAIRDLDGQAVGRSIEILAVRGIGRFGVVPAPAGPKSFPIVDEFGQYAHEDWPGKVHDPSDLEKQRQAEERDLEAHPGMPDRSRFGGWTKGPKLEATGHFRTAKHGGKWWLVDPEGHLFWSHGVTGVGGGDRTRVANRKRYFASPDQADDQGNVDFYQLNQRRKHGADWQAVTNELAHRRLRSWGMNTLGNWSDAGVRAMGRTPYVVPIDLGGKDAGWRKNPEAFRRILGKRMQREQGATSDDPWCIGYFVDNELRWEHVMDPEIYHRICREEVKRAAPRKLYLGSRLHGQNQPHGGPTRAALAASKYCDVVSINRYRFSPSDLSIPAGGIDKPILIGEFHFGSLDRGLLHTGLRSVGSQAQRADAYRHYLTQALAHPNIVGTHWFQFRDQPVSGRFDGENYQVGLVTITDDPYPEMVETLRRVGAHLYPLRAGE
jgi:hypothetical protein